jgi:hypothetical protein
MVIPAKLMFYQTVQQAKGKKYIFKQYSMWDCLVDDKNYTIEIIMPDKSTHFAPEEVLGIVFEVFLPGGQKLSEQEAWK